MLCAAHNLSSAEPLRGIHHVHRRIAGMAGFRNSFNLIVSNQNVLQRIPSVRTISYYQSFYTTFSIPFPPHQNADRTPGHCGLPCPPPRRRYDEGGRADGEAGRCFVGVRDGKHQIRWELTLIGTADIAFLSLTLFRPSPPSSRLRPIISDFAMSTLSRPTS